MYGKKPKMILFDVGGTLFNDGPCVPKDGFSVLRLTAKNPEITDDESLAKLWNDFMDEVDISLKSRSGAELDIPLSSVIKYAAMHTGLHFDIPMARQEEIFDRYNSKRNVIDGIPELFDTLTSLSVRYAIISNNMMSGDSLSLAIEHWIPSAKPEFCLSSADILFKKPVSTIFSAAAGYAHLTPEDCWYCGDSLVADVYGSKGCGMTPVLIDEKSPMPLEMRRADGYEYMAVNNWNVLREHLLSLK